MPENKGSVLYVGAFELPDRNAAAHRVLNNAKVLKNLGFNVIFCGVSKEPSEVGKKASVCGFQSIPTFYPKTSKQWIRRMFDIKDYLRICSLHSDIKYLICYNLHAAPMLKLLKFCKKKNITVISDCTEWYENKFSLNPVKFIKSIDTFFSMRFIQKKCDGMIAISSFLADYYKKYVKNIIVVPPLVDLDDEKFSQNEKQKNNSVTIVYSGSPGASKEALGEVVKALNNLEGLNYKFKIVGITREEFLDIYNTLPNKKIEFSGRVSHEEALNQVKSSDYSVVIRPKSRVTTAGFPTKFAEAISCGTAVIANDTSDIAKYLEDGKNGYLVNLSTLEDDFKKIITADNKMDVDKNLFSYKNYFEVFDSFFKKF